MWIPCNAALRLSTPWEQSRYHDTLKSRFLAQRSAISTQSASALNTKNTAKAATNITVSIVVAVGKMRHKALQTCADHSMDATEQAS